ncbi:MAG TPA: DUF2721 domain-containing protein [Steroidobacteraceae bacterium]
MTDLGGAQIQIIVEVIRLAVAPVFLLTGVGTMLAVLTNRLGRAVDRSRHLEAPNLHQPLEQWPADLHAQLNVLARRGRLLNFAITMCTLCALLVSVVIMLLFLGAFFEVRLARPIGVLFIVAMLSFISAMLCFLREIFLATAALRIGVHGRSPGGAEGT